jgi:hypothetical protein
MAKLILENRSYSDVSTEDSGQAKILEIADDREEHVFVRIQSWVDWEKGKQIKHTTLDQFIGKPIRVTIETL